MFNRKKAASSSMEVSSKPLLPHLKRDKLLQGGALDSFTGIENGLSEIAVALEDGRAPLKSDFHAIPDVFAQLALFESAIMDPGHTLHGDFMEQWRCLLTMILLHKELNLKLDVVEFDLRRLSNQAPILLHIAGEYLPRGYGGTIAVYVTQTRRGSVTPIALQSDKFFLCPANGIKEEPYNMPGFLKSAAQGDRYTNGVVSFASAAEYLREHSSLGFRMKEMLGELRKKNWNHELDNMLYHFDQDIQLNSQSYARLESGEVLIKEIKDLFPAVHHDALGNFPLRAETIFTERICVFSDTNLLVGGFSEQRVEGMEQDGKGCYALLPLSLEFVKAFARESRERQNGEQIDEERLGELAGGITLTCRDDGCIEAELQLRGKKYAKTYGAGDLVSNVISGAPPMVLWPNQVDPTQSWESYYLYHSAKIRGTMDNVYLQILDWQSNALLEGEYYQSGTDSFFITKSARFPYFLYGYCDFGDEKIPVGTLLVRPVGRLPEERNETAYVGIDFGTTNTIAYYSMHNEDQPRPAPVQFSTHTGMSIVEDSLKLFDLAIHKNFLPLNVLSANDGMFASILHVLKSEHNPPIVPLSEGNIFFLNPNETYVDTSNLATNLKWEERPITRINAMRFLAQLAMLCAWKCVQERAEKIHWRASYPTAFTENNLASYREGFKDALKAVSLDNGFAFDDDANADYDEDKNSFIITTENHAAGIGLGYYNAVNPKEGYLCIDIGGGSTDISLWQKKIYDEARSGVSDHAIIETSFRFAGNKILPDSIYHLVRDGNLESEKKKIDLIFQDCLGVDSSRIAWEKVRDKKEDFCDRFNILLPSIQKLQHNLRFNEATGIIHDLARIIEFNLSAIVAYAGFLISYASGGRDSLFNLDADGPALRIALCGNGSKLIDWTRPSFRDSLLPKVFQSGSSIENIQVKLIQSPIPKKEVATGLTAVKRLFFSEFTQCQDFIEAQEFYLVEKNGDSRHSEQKQLMQIFINCIEVFFEDEEYAIQEFPGWKCSMSEVLESLNICSGNFRSDGKRAFTFNDGFVALLQELNKRFYTGGAL